MALRLHWSPDSANLVVRIALGRLGLPFEAVAIDRARNAQRAPDYLRLNPQGLIPVLEDGPLVLFETGAILLHLADRAGRLGGAGPAAGEPAARARFLRWLFYVSNTLHADLRVSFYPHRHIAPEGIAALRAGTAARIAGHLDLIESVIASGPPGSGFGGAAPGLLDDYLGVCLRWAQLYPAAAPALPEGLGAWPRLAALLAGIEAEPAVQAATAAEGIPGARPFTAPEPPVLPPELPAAEVAG